METRREIIKKKIVCVLTAVILILMYSTAFCSYSMAAEEKPRMVAHGGGEIDGIRLTNSVEAVEASIEKGFKLIELDMLLSSDDEIIMLHDFGPGWTKPYLGKTFEERPSSEEFLECRIKGKYTPMTFGTLTKILDEHEDVMIITDCKEINYDLLYEISVRYPEYTDRVIPQIYYENQYDYVKNLGYENIILTLYSMSSMEYYKLSAFIDQSDLYAVTVGTEYKYSDVAERLARSGVCVYMHPVEDIGTALTLIDKNIYGIYTSTLMPAEFETDRAKDRINDWNRIKEGIYATCI